jgi:hypothetical protein
MHHFDPQQHALLRGEIREEQMAYEYPSNEAAAFLHAGLQTSMEQIWLPSWATGLFTAQFTFSQPGRTGKSLFISVSQLAEPDFAVHSEIYCTDCTVLPTGIL